MARGQAAKQEIMAVILETFADSFLYNQSKEIRINTVEDGEPVQIKVTLTAAKTPVTAGADTILPGEPEKKVLTEAETENLDTPFTPDTVQVSDEEKANIQKMLSALNL